MPAGISLRMFISISILLRYISNIKYKSIAGRGIKLSRVIGYQCRPRLWMKMILKKSFWDFQSEFKIFTTFKPC